MNALVIQARLDLLPRTLDVPGQFVCPVRNAPQLFRGRQAVRTGIGVAFLDRASQARDANREELIQQVSRDRQETQALQKRVRVVAGLFEDARDQREVREFAIQKPFRRACEWDAATLRSGFGLALWGGLSPIAGLHRHGGCVDLGGRLSRLR